MSAWEAARAIGVSEPTFRAAYAAWGGRFLRIGARGTRRVAVDDLREFYLSQVEGAAAPGTMSEEAATAAG